MHLLTDGVDRGFGFEGILTPALARAGLYACCGWTAASRSRNGLWLL